MSLLSSRNFVAFNAFKEVTMYEGRTLKVLNTMPALIVMAMILACKVACAAGGSITSASTAPSGPGASLIFSYPNGFSGASSAIQTAASAGFGGSAIELTTGTYGQHEAGAAWYKTLQNI